MGYRWKPSRSQREEFAERMQNPEEKAAYGERKRQKAEKRKASSQFDYEKAGGSYVPTYTQHDFCMMNNHLFTTSEQIDARNQVIYGYTCNEKVHHDYIHIVNELRRKQSSL